MFFSGRKTMAQKSPMLELTLSHGITSVLQEVGRLLTLVCFAKHLDPSRCCFAGVSPDASHEELWPPSGGSTHKTMNSNARHLTFRDC